MGDRKYCSSWAEIFANISQNFPLHIVTIIVTMIRENILYNTCSSASGATFCPLVNDESREINTILASLDGKVKFLHYALMKCNLKKEDLVK